MKKELAVLALSLCFAGPSAYAAEGELSQQFKACMDQSGGVGLDMQDCIQEETQLQDARLNIRYRALSASLPAARKKQLQTAQRLWIQYRDANCDFYFDPDGGTAARLSANECVMGMTADRAKELETLKQ